MIEWMHSFSYYLIDYTHYEHLTVVWFMVLRGFICSQLLSFWIGVLHVSVVKIHVYLYCRVYMRATRVSKILLLG